MKVVIDGSGEVEAAPGTSVSELLLENAPGALEAAIAARLNGRLVDLSAPVEEGRLDVVSWGDEGAEEVYRHTASHVMAQAVMELFPGTRLAIGPAIADGFYYDFDLRENLSPEDLPRIETRMGEIVARDEPLVREEWKREEAIGFFRGQGQDYKVELLEEIEDDLVTVYRQGEFTDLCRGPHLPSTGRLRFYKLLSLAGAYWRGDENRPMLQRIYGTAFDDRDEMQRHLDFLQ